MMKVKLQNVIDFLLIKVISAQLFLQMYGDKLTIELVESLGERLKKDSEAYLL